MKQRLDSPLRDLKGPKYRGLRRLWKRHLGRANKWPKPFAKALAHEMFMMAVDHYESMNRMFWSPERPRRYHRRVQ